MRKPFVLHLILVSLLFVPVFFISTKDVQAGSLSPSSAPASNGYTLSDIFNRLITNATAVSGSHDFAPTTTPKSTFPTLIDIYNAIPTIYATDFLASSTYFGVTGSIAVKAGDTSVASSSAQGTSLVFTIPVGYYSGASSVTVSTSSASFVSTNIKSGINLFGISGNSNVVDTTSGTAVAGDLANDKIAFVGGSQITGTMFTNQKNQTRDDWVNSGGTTGEYTGEEATWVTVTGSPFAGYDSINYAGSGGDLDLFSGAVKQDTRTGLWWSDISAVAGVASSTSNVFGAATDGTRPTGGNAIGFCDALNTANFAGHNDWYLPTQKQLMQAYIDGSANNLANPGYSFWSSTEHYNLTAFAWNTYLYLGYTGYSTKVTSYYVRCIRP